MNIIQMNVINVDHTSYSTKPELWEVDNNLYLVYPFKITTGRIVQQFWTGSELIVHTKRNSYCVDWLPTVRVMSKHDLIYERNLIHIAHASEGHLDDPKTSNTHPETDFLISA